MKKFCLQTQDNFTIHGDIYKPDGNIKGGVIINSATAVKKIFYEPFATFLANNGFVVLTYDYRGIGSSKPNSPSSEKKLTMNAWGKLDFDAVIQWAKNKFPQIQWHCVGHSVGGQLVGLAPNNKELESVYCVAAQNGYWKNWRWRDRFRVFAIWYLLVPFFTKVLGRVPGALLGGESLPASIAIEWARWCRHPDFIIDENNQPIREHFESLYIKMRFLAISDDFSFAPIKAVKALIGFYRNADSEYHLVDSQKISNRNLGHFGFFKRANQDSLWGDALNWLNDDTNQRA